MCAHSHIRLPRSPRGHDGRQPGEVSKVVEKLFSRQAILSALGESIAARTRFEELCLGARSEGLEEHDGLQRQGEQVIREALIEMPVGHSPQRPMGFRGGDDAQRCVEIVAELRPAFMKVDRSIVQQIERDEHKQRLMELLATFAHATGIQLIVEGIETEMEAAVVRRIGADMLQGYLFGRPGTPVVGPLPCSADR